MTWLWIILVLAAAAIVLYAWAEGRKHGTGAGHELAGICLAALESSRLKHERKQRVLALLGEHQEMNNSELRQAIGVSRRSVNNYIHELSREGRVIQVGETGRGVIYRLA